MVELTVPGRAVCPSAALQDGGRGVRFEVAVGEDTAPAFAVRYRGRVYAYLNRCAHLAVELDWDAGDFFDASGEHLVCATHGARYHPQTGACADGRCQGIGLRPLQVIEINGEVRLVETRPGGVSESERECYGGRD